MPKRGRPYSEPLVIILEDDRRAARAAPTHVAHTPQRTRTPQIHAPQKRAAAHLEHGSRPTSLLTRALHEDGLQPPTQGAPPPKKRRKLFLNVETAASAYKHKLSIVK